MALAEEEDLTSLVLVQGDRSVFLYKLLVKSHDGGNCVALLVWAGVDFSEECTESDLLQKVFETWGGDKKSKQITPSFLALIYFYSLYALSKT